MEFNTNAALRPFYALVHCCDTMRNSQRYSMDVDVKTDGSTNSFLMKPYLLTIDATMLVPRFYHRYEHAFLPSDAIGANIFKLFRRNVTF